MVRNPLIRRNPPSLPTNTLHKSAGILDDHAIRKNVATKEGTIEHIPTLDNHITNKLYCDGLSSQVKLDEIENPDGDTSFNFAANKHLHFVWSGEATGDDGLFEIEGRGGFSGDLVHIHQHTGNVLAASDLLHCEADDDDVCVARFNHTGTGATLEIGAAGAATFVIDEGGNITTAQAGHDVFSDHVANEHIDWTADVSPTVINAANYVDNDTTDHTALSNIGTNTHAQIDTAVTASTNHIADVTGDPHAIAADTLTFTNKTIDANGTGNSITNIDVSDLANGTDGELITWDASGVADTVAVGTATHVLTSNGAGAAPTFQAAAGGGHDDVSCRVQESSGQTITNNTVTLLLFNEERWDTDSIHDNATNTSRLTVPVAGKYLIFANIQWAANATGRRLTQFRINGTTTVMNSEEQVNAAVTFNMADAAVWDLAANDYVECLVLQTSGGNLNVNGGGSPWQMDFGIQLLAAT